LVFHRAHPSRSLSGLIEFGGGLLITFGLALDGPRMRLIDVALAIVGGIVAVVVFQV